MSSGDELTCLWSDGLGRAAGQYERIVAGDFVRRHGVSRLHDVILQKIVDEQVSVLIIDVSSPLYDPFVISDLQRVHNVIVVLFAIDDEFKFDWITSTYATGADLVLTTDHVSGERCRQAGINAHDFMLPVHIPPEPSAGAAGGPYGVTFVGRVDSGKPSRAAFARRLAEHGIDVTYFSSLGPDDPKFLTRDAMYAVFRQSAINLSLAGITTYLNPFDHILHERIRGYKIRPFEITAAGGFCLSEYSSSLARWLDDGVDVVFFRNEADLIAKIQYYLVHQDEAKRIAETGSRKIRDGYSGEAVGARVAALIEACRGQMGKDLYGAPRRTRVARQFASTFLVTLLSNSAALLFKGRWRASLRDAWSAFRFTRRLSADVGTFSTFRLAAAVSGRLMKMAIAAR